MLCVFNDEASEDSHFYPSTDLISQNIISTHKNFHAVMFKCHVTSRLIGRFFKGMLDNKAAPNMSQ